MEVGRPHNLQDDCRSLGSNFHQSSQSRKISIGITLDSLGTKRYGATKKDETNISNAERINSNTEKSLEGKSRGKGVTEVNEDKQTEAVEKVTSPWITTRYFQQESPTSKTIVFGKQTSKSPATGERRNKFRRAKDTTITHSVQVFENQMSVLGSADGNQKNFKGLTYKRKGSKDGDSQKAEEVTFATAQEVPVSDKAATENKREDGRTETLRMKLFEILGTVSSPRSQHSNSQARESGANNLTLEKIHHQKVDLVAMPIQGSKTIKTYSENSGHKMNRPVTRSLTRNRVTSKAQPAKKKTGPSSSFKNNLHEKKIFSFEEGLFGQGDVATRKKDVRKNSGIEPRRIDFSENTNIGDIQGGNCRSEAPLPAEKASSHSGKVENFRGRSPESKNEYLELKNGIQVRDSSRYPRKISHITSGEYMVEEQGNVSNHAVTENEDKEDFGQPSFKKFMDPPDEFQSPTFKINTPLLSSSPGSTPKTDQVEKIVYSSVTADRKFTLGKIHSLETLKNSNADSPAPIAENESSDDEMEHKDFPRCKPSPLEGRKGVEDGLSRSSEDDDSTSSEEGSLFIEYRSERFASSPATVIAERCNVMFYPSKRLRNLKGKDVSRFSAILSSTEGTDEGDRNPEPSEVNQEKELENQEKALERVITQFDSALEQFKNKMRAATRKKSSDILISVSEEIHLQLQNVASQIQTDVGELTSCCKSKRKRLETRFEEQQKKLKLIQDKFKKDIHQHLQDCQSTVEELGMHQIELKGTIKKQKASHQKLIMNVEEAVETQLNDAHRRITAVHKWARQIMLQMRQLIAECLNEDNLS